MTAPRTCRECGKPSDTRGLICPCSCHPVERCGSGWTGDACHYRAGHDGPHCNEHAPHDRHAASTR